MVIIYHKTKEVEEKEEEDKEMEDNSELKYKEEYPNLVEKEKIGLRKMSKKLLQQNKEIGHKKNRMDWKKRKIKKKGETKKETNRERRKHKRMGEKMKVKK